MWKGGVRGQGWHWRERKVQSIHRIISTRLEGNKGTPMSRAFVEASCRPSTPHSLLTFPCPRDSVLSFWWISKLCSLSGSKWAIYHEGKRTKMESSSVALPSLTCRFHCPLRPPRLLRAGKVENEDVRNKNGSSFLSEPSDDDVTPRYSCGRPPRAKTLIQCVGIGPLKSHVEYSSWYLPGSVHI